MRLTPRTLHTVGGIAVGAFLCFAPAPSSAFTPAEILSFLKARNPECAVTLDKTPMQTAPVAGSKEPVTVIRYRLDACGGGNNWAEQFAAFSAAGPKLAAYRFDQRIGQISNLSIENRAILVQTRDYKPNDPLCCPSRLRTYRFIVRDMNLVQVR